jgi:hypothetical protein
MESARRILGLLFALGLDLSSTTTQAAPTVVTVSNVALRHDTQGRIVNAHDGCLVQFPTSVAPPSSSSLSLAPSTGATPYTFWLYGTVYEDCVQEGAVCDGKCGYLGNLFAAYSSPDLQTWTLESANVLPALAKDNARVSYWEANVAFNNATGMFVMVYWSGNYGFVNSSIAVAVSSTAAGPFVPSAPINAKGAAVISDTVSLFVDDDGTAYVRYNTIDLPKRHVVEKLTPDWLNTTGEYAVIFEKPDFPWLDGGGMFRRGAFYYVMLSFDCCFCSWGSDARIFVAPSPMGPWVPQNATGATRAGKRKNGVQPPSALPAPPRPAALSGPLSCNLTGSWIGVLAGQPVGNPSLSLVHDAATNNVTITGAVDTWGYFDGANASLVIPDFPVGNAGTLVAAIGPYNGSTADPCSELLWLPPFSPQGSFWCRYPACSPPVEPPNNATNEANFCADGTQPPSHVQDMNINPCSQLDVWGTNFTVPAQQFGVSVFRNASAQPGDLPLILYFGEHFRSAPDGTGLKSHDLQAWIPLEFSDDAAADGGERGEGISSSDAQVQPPLLLPMQWLEEFQLWLD